MLVPYRCPCEGKPRFLSRQLRNPETKEKATLINHFLADGIEEVAFVFEFLPDCVANAMKNPVVTLTGLLEMLEELLGLKIGGCIFGCTHLGAS